MPTGEALEIVSAVASALDYSHGKGLLHRDVKPANILVADVEPGERRLLGHFGVARDLGDSTAAGLTATKHDVGGLLGCVALRDVVSVAYAAKSTSWTVTLNFTLLLSLVATKCAIRR